MHELPESVRERLAATGASVDHPDADLLTAFAEGSLSGRERQSVLAHLGQCGQCRDVVALAGSATEAAAPVPATPERKRFSWPMIRRFVVPAAALVVVVGAVTLRSPWRKIPSAPEIDAVQKQAEMAQEKAASPATAPPPASSPAASVSKEEAAAAKAPVPSRTEARTEAKTKAMESGYISARSRDAIVAPPRADEGQLAKKDNDAKVVIPRPSGALIGGLRQSGPMASADSVQSRQQQTQAFGTISGSAGAGNFAQQQRALNETQDSADNAGNRGVAGAQLNNNQVAANKQNLNTGAGSMQTAPRSAMNSPASHTAPAAPPPSVNNQVSVTSESETVEVVPEAAAVAQLKSLPAAPNGGPMPVSAAKVAPLSFHWTINPAGDLLRSPLQPEAWKRIAVPGHNKVRSVSANGADVWIATVSGQLYHSIDAGITWAAIQLPAAGYAIGVHFNDALQGSLTIGSTPIPPPTAVLADEEKAATQVWATRDGGRTWQKKD